MPKLEAVSRQEPLAAISFRFIQLTCVLEIATELKITVLGTSLLAKRLLTFFMDGITLELTLESDQ